MKFKFISIMVLMLLLSAGTAYAANGDIVHPIYYTDITTFMDGIPIQGYAIKGKTMICLEDLLNYGFSVCYSDEARALFLNKQGKAADNFCPDIKREQGSGIAGYTYETDIKAYVNGNEISAENIGGRLAACIEELADFDSVNSVHLFDFTYSSYFMWYYYDDSTRTLNVFSDISENVLYDECHTSFIEAIDKSEGLFFVKDSFSNEEYSQYIVSGIYRDSSNFDGCDAVRFYKNGRILDAERALCEYEFIAYPMKNGLSLIDIKFSEDGRYLCFFGKRSKSMGSPAGWRNEYEDGEYMLDMNTFELIKVDVKGC